ncbi:MAG: energy-coupling factor ABC transporter permease [Firmicutes bacterium]|nr:energy-coupling factor ABC transporter permease [Bacillota bacterium]
MSHIHLPDGVLPVSWWLLAYVAAFIWLYLALRQAESEKVRRKLPFLAAMSTLMLLTMSVPLGPLPVHLNLTVLTGIIVGPWLGFVAVFVVNIMLSLLGHGGLTAVGMNTLVTGLEVVLGWWLYHHLFKTWRLSWRSLGATGMALLLTSALALSLISLSTGVISLWHAHSHEELGVEQAAALGNSFQFLGLSGVMALVFILACGLVTEAIATWGIVSYLHKVRPELLMEELEP